MKKATVRALSSGDPAVDDDGVGATDDPAEHTRLRPGQGQDPDMGMEHRRRGPHRTGARFSCALSLLQRADQHERDPHAIAVPAVVVRRRRRALVYAVLLVLAALFMFPFYWLLISAFKARDQIFVLPPEFWPHPWRFINLARVFQETRALRHLFNSVVIAVGHCGLALFLCSLAGHTFAKFPHAPGRDKLFAFVLATMMISGAVLLIPVFVILCKLHIINTYLAMIIPGAAGAFGIFWIRQYAAQNVHNDLLDAARIDRCGEFAIYLHIVLPVLQPALAALGIVLLISIWNNLMWAYIVLRTENMYTLPLVIYLLQGDYRIPYDLIMGVSLVATLPLVAGFLLFQKRFIEGITAGAMKG